VGNLHNFLQKFADGPDVVRDSVGHRGGVIQPFYQLVLMAPILTGEKQAERGPDVVPSL